MHQTSFPPRSRLSIASEDADRFIDVERLAAIALRQTRVVALCAAVGLALGVLYLVFTPAEYTAATRILLDDSLTKFAEEKDGAPVRIQADSMISSEVEILKSARLARAVVLAEKLHHNEAFLNPPRSPIGWAKDQVKSIAGLFSFSATPSAASGENARIGKAVALLQSSLRAERAGRSYVIDVSFKSNDRNLAGAITRAYAEAYLSDQLDANFDATQRATIWLQGRLDELRDSSQAAALEVAKFRAENGLTAARGELISEQQLSDLNSQLILAQAETANAFGRYSQFKSIIDSGPENAVRNATIPSDNGNSAVINDLKTRYLGVTKREREIAARFGEDHAQAVALRREEADLERQIFRELQQITESYRNEYEVAKARETSLRENVGDMAGQSSETSESMVQLRALEQRSTALAALYQTFLARHEEASQQRSFPIAKARVISEAGNPVSPSSPRKTMVLGLSLVLGVFAGAGVGALQEFRERFFRTGDDVRSALNISFLGYLPIVGAGLATATRPAATGPRPGDRLPPDQGDPVTPGILRVAVKAPASLFAETLRNAKIAIDVVLQNKPCKVIGFVSVLPHEGKTTAAANFAGLLASQGARTLLIDGDLRNPGLSRGLALAPDKGLVEAIVGHQPWRSAVLVDRSTKLAVMPATLRGRLSHTSELISGPGMRDLIEEARTAYDYIIVDLPPLGPVVDAKAFAPLADGFVLVAEWGQTPRALVRATLQAEPELAAKVLGIMLNKADMKKLARYASFGGSEQYLDRYSAYYVEQVGMNGKAG
ncbi:polysaccharide biosynthesis tyrosine autokinase [Arvimicrobium flavum]|uniref:polysaccharide biosynthesis tyrosine autokinase n=1 Tax=Arvimicrobium flavum TaxID=3393320 RepID=UPI00237B641C|nr:polysaccharide biosynthesis tyrosine autokinase [Mesorhizobium shangrilense]